MSSKKLQKKPSKTSKAQHLFSKHSVKETLSSKATMSKPSSSKQSVREKSNAGDSSDEDLFSDSEDDSEVGSVIPAGDELLFREVEETKCQVNELINKPINSSLFNALLKSISTSARYQDILPQIIDGKQFFIDGDSLLMFALTSKGLSMDNGGQTLHIVYVVEKFLMSFSSRNLKFTIIFFEIWNVCWERFPHFSIARSALKLHLLHNLKTFSVLSMRSMWGEEFSCLVEDIKPSFILMTTELPEFLTATLGSKENWMPFILNSQSAYCGFLCLDFVDIETVHSTAAGLMATVHTNLHNFQGIKAQIERLEKRLPVLKKTEKIDELPVSNMRSSIIILASARILSKILSKDTINVVKTVLLTATVLEFIPLKMRCFKNLLTLPSKVTKILKQFQTEMAFILNQLCPDSPLIDFQQAGDLWQGIFIQAVFNCVCEVGVISCEGDLGNIIASRYEELLAHVNKKICQENVHPYPIENMCGTSASHVLLEVSSTGNTNFESNLIPTTCKLTEMFTGALACNKLFYSASSLREFDSNDILHESRHWHNKKPLTDDLEQIPDNEAKNAPTGTKRYSQNTRNTLARFYTIYGLSLEGRSSISSIVTNPSKPNERQKKKVDQPKSQPKGKLNKKEKIIEANIKRIQEEKQRQMKDRIEGLFVKDFSSLMLKRDFSAAIEKCDTELKYASDFPEVVLEVLFSKAEACFELWKSECYSKQSNRNLYGAKELFLVIREIFEMADKSKQYQCNLKKINKLSTWLHELGFKDLCAMKGLPDPANSLRGNLEVGMNHVEFQLTHLRADLIRETGGVADPRADGFIPDPWQVELFDIIDKKQSAVVIAPTSSGKTYASYYCMEQVIRESDDGVVVYVCPTKALVNQVYATIYARFKKTLPAGKTLLGTLTRDFRQNVTNCQILTTTPETFQILLMSPRCQTWARRIKYVIFDEVHCLVAQGGGLTWETCILLNRSPFLALSATISKPEEFCGWLQKVEDFKQKLANQLKLHDRHSDSYKVSLILHLERHNHLIKSVMMNDGSITHVHPFSFLSRRSSDIPEHISLAPDEALELYVSMKQALKSEEISNFCLLKYFHELCPSGFLSMQSVRKFSETLRNMLREENLENRGKVLDNLHRVDLDSSDTTDAWILKNIPVALNSLKEKGLMPALAFSYNRNFVETLSMYLLQYLRSIDNFAEDKETDVEMESDTEVKKSSTNKELRRYRTKKFVRKLGIMRGPSMLNSAGSVRGAGVHDEKLIDFIERRLISAGHKAMQVFPSLLRRGLGKHHGGMNNKERSAVEMLFRSRLLNLVFATGSLALGIHMPCKTVIVAGDSPYLNALEFHQMSGRAGRRGFDKEGNVIFYGLHKRKMEALMTGTLPSMVGNFPLSASLILRLLLLVTDTTIEGKFSQEATAESCARAYTLLENGLLYESQKNLKSTMEYFFFFVVQFLMRQNLLQSDGKPHVHATFIIHLHYHEPGNFAFYFLLNSGVLEEMCNCHNGRVTEESLRNLVTVLNFLFGRVPLTKNPKLIKRSNSVVLLPPLPQRVIETLKEYNRKVFYTFRHYFKCVASDLKEKFGDEKNLPLSQLNVQPDEVLCSEALKEGKLLPALGSICRYSNVCSSFAGLSGNTDEDVYSASGDIHHVREDVNVKIVPTLELDFKCNAYVLDFYKHGIAEAICRQNGLRSGNDFALLRDFLLVSKAIYMSLSEMLSPDAKLLQAMMRIVSTFEANFTKAYYAYQ